MPSAKLILVKFQRHIISQMTAEEVKEIVEADEEVDLDPINDIIDYLVRCAKISFRNTRVNETEVRTSDKVQMACSLYKKSPTNFLMQFGKYLAPHHLDYFDTREPPDHEREQYLKCMAQLRKYHSNESIRKRVRNRRYRALQKLNDESDYFSEKEMMYRNPLLYEQLVGQYLTEEEVQERDGVDRENLTFLNMILETVDRNQMRETKNKQMLEDDDSCDSRDEQQSSNNKQPKMKPWGNFETPDTTPSFNPEARKQAMITAPERDLLRKEFLQEMYTSFIEGRDVDIDYRSIDNDEQYDDLQQVSQDAEDHYFDSETNEVGSLEEHMELVQEYGRKQSDAVTSDDPLDIFMDHIKNKPNF